VTGAASQEAAPVFLPKISRFVDPTIGRSTLRDDDDDDDDGDDDDDAAEALRQTRTIPVGDPAR